MTDGKTGGRSRAGFVWAPISVGIATSAAWLARDVLALPDLVMLYLLAIMSVAVVYERGPAILAAGLSVAAYDFFFIPPRFTLAVSDIRHALTFLMMFIVGTVMSALTGRIKEQERQARLREARTATLYDMIRALSTCRTEEEVASCAAQSMSSVFNAGVAILWPDDDRKLSVLGQSGAIALDAQDLQAAQRCFEGDRVEGRGGVLACLPLSSIGGALGVVAVQTTDDGDALDFDRRALLESLTRQITLVAERTAFEKAAESASSRAREEEMRSSLLSAISHDLRTPLASIRGSATALEEALASSPLRDLAATIAEESERLGRIVSNILDMTRLETGALTPKQEWVPLEEVVGSAIALLEANLVDHTLECELPPQPLLVFVDPVLLQQLLVNLIENATKHTPPGTEIEITAKRVGTALELIVADRGPGLEPDQQRHLFEKFYRGARSERAGAGLGLSICRAIVTAHGGQIAARARHNGGTEFIVSLPLPTPPDLIDAPAQGSS